MSTSALDCTVPGRISPDAEGRAFEVVASTHTEPTPGRWAHTYVPTQISANAAS